MEDGADLEERLEPRAEAAAGAADALGALTLPRAGVYRWRIRSASP
jgi:hypothetical protein